jgi:AcrR family transcriptional regulator
VTVAHARRLPAAERKDLVLDAAELIFGRSGYHGATTRAVAAEAGVSEGLLYQHFPGKRQLFEAVVVRALDRLEAALVEAAVAPRPFQAGMAAYFEFVERERDLHRVFFRQALEADPIVAGLYDAFIERIAERFEAPVVVTEGLIGMANQLALWWADRPAMSREEIVDHAARMAEAAYLAEVEFGSQRAH